jgi:hypothetical protein
MSWKSWLQPCNGLGAASSVPCGVHQRTQRLGPSTHHSRLLQTPPSIHTAVSCVVEEADAVHLLMTWGCGRNKGIDNYPAGNDYRYIAIKSSTVKPGSLEGLATTQAAVGFPCVATPDGYKFMLVDTDEGDAAEPFLFVSLNVSDLEAAKTFYCDGLGAKVVPGGAGTLGTADSCVLDFVNTPGVLAGGVKLELVQLPAGECTACPQTASRQSGESAFTVRRVSPITTWVFGNDYMAVLAFFRGLWAGAATNFSACGFVRVAPLGLLSLGERGYYTDATAELGLFPQCLLAGEALDHALAPGRFALETEDGAPDKVAAKMEAIGGTIAHGPFKLQPHGEEVVIVQDGDGHEYCFVDARGYTNCISVRDAVGGTDIVWDYRDKLHAAAALPTEAERKLVCPWLHEGKIQYSLEAVGACSSTAPTSVALLSRRAERRAGIRFPKPSKRVSHDPITPLQSCSPFDTVASPLQ